MNINCKPTKGLSLLQHYILEICRHPPHSHFILPQYTYSTPTLPLPIVQPIVHLLQYCAAEVMTNYTQFSIAQLIEMVMFVCYVLCVAISDGRGPHLEHI